MIYISSSCVKFDTISESIRYLAENGFRNIELSGGTNYYEQLSDDLIKLKTQYDLSFTIHNYFPPPPKHFVLNLSSSDEEIYALSFEHYKKAINLAKQLDIEKIGIHAGFLFDPKVKELGKDISLHELIDRENGLDRFCNAYNSLIQEVDEIQIYIENNVVSNKNFNTYRGNPFLLTNFEDYLELRERINFPLILDVGHLKVSSNTLKLDFSQELSKFLQHTDYLHLSENDGLTDSNDPLLRNDMLKTILDSGINNKTITLEIYDDIKKIKASYELLN
ncbi:MAG: TIM barrel protein [Bacteroidota bacterium]